MKTSTNCTYRVRISAFCTIVLTVGFAARATAADYIRSYPIAGRAHVEVRAENATVRVTTADSPKVAFDVSYDPRDWSGQTLPISSRQSGDSVTLTLIPQRHEWWGWDFWNWGQDDRRRLNVEVRLPRNADLQLQTSNGAVDVASLNGDIGIHTSNGQIRAEQLSGTMDIGSSNAAIALETLKGTLKVHTSNGAIGATGLDGKCRIYTSNGRIQVSGRFDSLDISSSNGSVTARAESGSNMSSGWTIRTSNSQIDLSVPTDLKATLNASTSNGSITIELPVTVQGIHSRTQLAGTINGGGPELSISTSNGSMWVRGI
jgi:Putative adhesin